MNRRNFMGGLAGILAAGFAPAAIGNGVLMPVRKVWSPHSYYVTLSMQFDYEAFWGAHMKATIAAFELGQTFPPIDAEPYMKITVVPR